ncbi:hypothetical protein [Paenibacillus sp. sgz302251]|uniref:hypothetical protein n=1 Tax=Paenibacillus sp. sgz302251 TaxID=3414493 RepID=UPI003C7D3D7A
MEGKNVIVIGADHSFADRMCRIWLDEGRVVLAAMTGSGLASQVDSKHRIRFDPLEEQSVQEMAMKASEVMERIDMAVCCFYRRKESRLRDGIDSRDVMEMYDYNALAPLRAIEALLPHMTGGCKRIGFLSDVRGSVTEPRGARHIGYDMSLAARQMSIKIMSNALFSEGYTFRIALMDMERENAMPEDELARTVCRRLSDFADQEALKLFIAE